MKTVSDNNGGLKFSTRKEIFKKAIHLGMMAGHIFRYGEEKKNTASTVQVQYLHTHRKLMTKSGKLLMLVYLIQFKSGYTCLYMGQLYIFKVLVKGKMPLFTNTFSST